MVSPWVRRYDSSRNEKSDDSEGKVRFDFLAVSERSRVFQCACVSSREYKRANSAIRDSFGLNPSERGNQRPTSPTHPPLNLVQGSYREHGFSGDQTADEGSTFKDTLRLRWILLATLGRCYPLQRPTKASFNEDTGKEEKK